ncbi:MAG: DUF3105 domain-containing protein [SAR324 cluster bacterium]|nr:DUF3105 domain-containing protein [SAR324 cluster bacterium]
MARKSSKKEHRAEQAREKTRRKRQKWMLWALALAVAAGGGAWLYERQANLPGQQFETMGQLHIPQGTLSYAYNSSPPTSGPHANAVRWGEQSASIPEINQVHNLEHGGVLIQYNCSRLSEDQTCSRVRTQLRGIMRKARQTNGHKIVLAPYGKMPHPIAITAWTWLQSFDTPDEAAMLAFAEAHYNNAPEDVR